MKLFQAREDYLKAIFLLHKKQSVVRAVDIADYLGYSKPSISHMIKELIALGYVEVKENNVCLTKVGLEIAVSIYTKNCMLYNLFVALGVSTEIAKTDACKIEHSISNETFEAVKFTCETLLKTY